MKKVILGLSIAIASLSSHAAYLYWQVGDVGSTEDVAKGIVWAQQGDGTPIQLTSYYLAADESGNAVWTVATDGAQSSLTTYAADIGDKGPDSGYSYWVELSNSSGEVVAKSSTIADSSSDFASYTSGASSTATLPAAAAANVWHGGGEGGGGYTPVPEPTSAILVLFGAAMLGLKRKQRRLI